MVAVVPLWSGEGLGWRRGLMGTECPAQLVSPDVHMFGFQGIIPISAGTTEVTHMEAKHEGLRPLKSDAQG